MKILKFGAIWCPGCLVMRPMWKKIEEENPWLETEYFDFDKDKKAVSDYQIDTKLPVFIFLGKNGDELERIQGERSRKEIMQLIDQYRES